MDILDYQSLACSTWAKLQGLVTPSSVPIMARALDIYLNDPLFAIILVAALVIFLCWFISVITGNYSQVDKLWSLLPEAYVFHFFLNHLLVDVVFIETPKPIDLRLAIMTAVTMLWGTRLTWNFARKGGYTSEGEDYRWLYLRAKLHPILFQLLNITFIAVIQNVIILAFALPSAIAHAYRGQPLNVFDLVAAGLYLTFLLGETIADQQQWAFQTTKYELIAEKKLKGTEYEIGFLTTGLFKFSRHPNFFCEISLWWSFYLFSYAASGVHNWSFIGASMLNMLFHASTTFTEKITGEKYPLYAEYQKTTSRLLPLWPGEPLKVKQQ